MDSKKIGIFIAMNRKKKGLTQEQLGEKLGVSNKTISRWENGNYMPDISLLEPLSKELGVSLNELLAGEIIEKEKVIEYSEKNLVSTIDYSTQKIKNEHKKISIFVMLIGIFMCFCAFSVFVPESSWGAIFSILGVILIVLGIFRELKIASLWKKIFASIGLLLLLLSIFFIIDFIDVSEFKRPPIFRYTTITRLEETKIIEYRSLFYSVYRINADTPNEYFVVDTKKEYNMDTVPITPFNRDKSGIDNIIKYRNQYVGNNSNTGNLINTLPLSEYGFVFEIDSKNYGVIINYHFTDWYRNENLYVEKALVYNSVSIFSLIDNLEYIKFNFSGSEYYITRDIIEKNYPNYQKIFTNNEIDKEKFNIYVEKKMNDRLFVSKNFSLFKKG